jgi:pimeloyl-ACP methyl ester carboxylesterase
MKKHTIVILHGWGLSGKSFTPLARALEKYGYKVVAPDMPGFGQEPAPKHPWKLSDYAGFVDNYLKSHKIKNPIFLGHSFGGRVSLKYIQLHEHSMPVVILTGTPGFTPIPRKKLLLFIAIAKVGGLVFKLPALNLFSDWVRRWYYYVVGAKEFFRAEGPMRQTFKNIVQEELVSAMQSVNIPSLLLWGEYDVIVPTVIAQRMIEVLPNAKLYIIPEADHGVPFKQPEVFAKYVDTFLNSI